MNIFRFISLLILALLFAIFTESCFRKTIKPQYLENPVIFPAPPDTARIQFLTKISNSGDVTGYRTAFAKFLVGTRETVLTFGKPYGAVLHDGKLYVCDNSLKGLEIIDFTKRTFEYFIPTGKGQLKSALNCDIDSSGYLYIADPERKQIVIFDNNRKYFNCFGDTGTFKPTDVVAYSHKLWVANLKGNEINVFEDQYPYTKLYSIGDSIPENPGYLRQPTNIEVTDDRIYVTNMGSNDVKVFDLTGNYIMTVGSTGKYPGQFIRPKGNAVDKQGNIYVVDASFHNVQIFNSKGEILMFFGGTYTGPGYMWLPSTVTIDYENLGLFKDYVDPSYRLKYLIIVVNQYGPDLINIYGYIEPKEKSEMPDGNKERKE